MSRMGTSNQRSTSESYAALPEMSAEEKALVKQMTDVGVSQGDAVKAVIAAGQQQGNVNALSLNATDQATLDQAYGGAEQNLRRQGFLLGQDLAGTRGLNPSDTPVSEAVLRELLPAMASLQGQKAQQSLGLGMDLARLNENRRQFNMQSLLNSAQTTPAGLGFNLGRMQNERFASAHNYGTNQQWNTGSILDQMNQGAQFRYTMHAGTNQASQAGMNGMKMGMMGGA
jgi:hypothetical protein